MRNRNPGRQQPAFNRPRVGVLAATISAVFAGAGPAVYAQDAPEGEPEEVVVTGSRIVRRDFSAPSPIMTVEAQTFEQSSTVSLESVLNQYPQFVPTGTQFDNANIEPSAFETPGVSNVNLRGLGSNRNLVLVDGRRLQPANPTLVVDVGTIPSAAIRSVEAITGGASSVYGADAVSGVVNFILRDDFEGIDIDIQTGATAEGDGEESRFSMLFGGNLAEGRGNVMFGAEWSERKAVLDIDRQFVVDGWNDPGTSTGNVAATYWNPPGCAGFGAAGCPTQAAVDTVFGDVAAAGTVNRGNDMHLNADGTVFQRQGAVSYNGPLGGDSYRKIQVFNGNVLGQTNTEGLVSSPLERYSLFSRAVYDINDDIRAFAQGTFSKVEVNSVGPWNLGIAGAAASIPHGTGIYAASLLANGNTAPAYLPGGAFGLNCPAVGGCTNSQAFPTPPELTALLDSRGTPNANWALERYFDFLPSRQTNNQTTLYQIQTGVEGSFPNRDWTWEAYLSQGETTVDSYLFSGWLSDQRWKRVAQSPNYGRGAVITGTIGTSIRCTTGLPLIEDFPMSADCFEAMEARMKQYTRLEQTIVEANLQGGIVDMPAGELRFAAGVSRRENSALYEPDPLIDAQSIADSPVGLFPQNETQGDTDVSEIYGELLIPLLERFNLELGVRHSDYNTTGGLDTHKALFDWAATDSLRVRGGRQIANRAPNIAEQFTGPSQNVVGFFGSDPCSSDTANLWGNNPSNPNRAQVQALCSAIIGNPNSDWDQNPNGFVGPFGFFPLEIEVVLGNSNVGSEEAETYTLGAVFQRDSWSFSIDYYTIDLKGAISPPSAFDVYAQCFNANGTSNPSYSINDSGGFCANIVRDPVTGWRQQVDALYTNFGALETDGVDLQLNWRGDIGANSVYVNFLMTTINSYKIQPVPGGPFTEYAGTLGAGGQYDYRTYTTFGYNLSSLNLGLRWIHLPEVDNAQIAQNPAATVQPTSSHNRFDLFGNWSMRENMELRFGVDNLFDTDPEIVGYDPGVTNALGSTNQGYYDILGRRYYAGLKFSF
jgi:outer membrane receptor protein involved in Fe transport